MKKFDNIEQKFKILRKIHKNPFYSQRELASDLGFSLGKLNYCIQALKKKGLIKINNFKKNKKKINYIYILTPEGINQKLKLTIRFMKEKIREYDELKRDISLMKEKIHEYDVLKKDI